MAACLSFTVIAEVILILNFFAEKNDFDFNLLWDWWFLSLIWSHVICDLSQQWQCTPVSTQIHRLMTLYKIFKSLSLPKI